MPSARFTDADVGAPRCARSSRATASGVGVEIARPVAHALSSTASARESVDERMCMRPPPSGRGRACPRSASTARRNRGPRNRSRRCDSSAPAAPSHPRSRARCSYMPSRNRPSTTSARSFTAPPAPKSSSRGRRSSRRPRWGRGVVRSTATLASSASCLSARTAAASSSAVERTLGSSASRPSTTTSCTSRTARTSSAIAATPPPGTRSITGSSSRRRMAAAPTPARVVSSIEPRRKSSIRARPSMASARSRTRSTIISPE